MPPLREDRKRAEIEYPERIGDVGREWLRIKPFRGEPRLTARFMIDFGLVVSLLELAPGISLCELGCGPGWMTILAARQGVDAAGYDISPDMIRIARERARAEGIAATFEVADMESLDLGRRFDACLVYDAVHHTPRPDLVFRSAHRALRPGGRLLVAEPNWMHRFQRAGREFGATELGHSPRRLKRLLHEEGFTGVERFHKHQRAVYGNTPGDIARHLAGPFLVRALAPFWTQIWLRATAR